MDFFINEIVESDKIRSTILANIQYAERARVLADEVIAGKTPTVEKGMETVFVLGYLADYALKINTERKIPKEITVATLKDVNVWFKNYKTETGKIGIGEWDWLWHHYTGKMFRLGRLQFHIIEQDGREVINTHIPQDEPLALSECIESFDLAREFFKKHFPENHPDRFVCSSWLLSENLVDILKEESNIVKFMRLWTKTTIDEDDSAQAKERVFGFDFDGNIENAPENTSLQKSLKAYLLSGKQIKHTHGYILI